MTPVGKVNQSSGILGLAINSNSLDTLVGEAIRVIRSRSDSLVMVCANPHSLAVAQKDDVFYSALENANHLLADGVGLVLAGKLFGGASWPRITGDDYFEGLSEGLSVRANELERKPRIFFFGSSSKVLNRIRSKMAASYPELEVCGVISPPFGEWDEISNQEMIEQINVAKPDVLWVGMTAPKQEKWVAVNRDKLQVPVIGSIGAVFDFFAGTYPRAPQWMCSMGLEWAYRILKEPKRMWSRTFVSLPRFLFAVIRG